MAQLSEDEVAFRSMIRASGLGEVWTHTTDEEKFKQYGWRTTTKEDCYSPNTLVGNWCEEKFDIQRIRIPKRLPSQVSLISSRYTLGRVDCAQNLQFVGGG